MKPVKWTRGDTVPLDFIPRGPDGVQIDLTGATAHLRIALRSAAHSVPAEVFADRLRFVLSDASMPPDIAGVFDADLRIAWPDAPLRRYARLPVEIEPAP